MKLPAPLRVTSSSPALQDRVFVLWNGSHSSRRAYDAQVMPGQLASQGGGSVVIAQRLVIHSCSSGCGRKVKSPSIVACSSSSGATRWMCVISCRCVIV